MFRAHQGDHNFDSLPLDLGFQAGAVLNLVFQDSGIKVSKVRVKPSRQAP